MIKKEKVKSESFLTEEGYNRYDLGTSVYAFINTIFDKCEWIKIYDDAVYYRKPLKEIEYFYIPLIISNDKLKRNKKYSLYYLSECIGSLQYDIDFDPLSPDPGVFVKLYLDPVSKHFYELKEYALKYKFKFTTTPI
jgi:hypothetical protein